MPQSNKKQPNWYAGTRQCIEANTSQLESNTIARWQANQYIIAHIKTLLEVELNKREQYIQYVTEYAEQHEIKGNYPVCYEEWLDNENSQ